MEAFTNVPGSDSVKSKKSVATLVNDMLNEEPILANLVKAIASGDDSNVYKALNDGGYEVFADDSESPFRQLESADEQNIWLWTGIYIIKSPDWLSGKKLVLFNKTKKVIFDDKEVKVQVSDSNTITWRENDTTYILHFSESNIDDQIRNSFSGTVTTQNGQTEQIQGEQYILTPEKDWVDEPRIKTILGGLGLLGIFSFLDINFWSFIRAVKWCVQKSQPVAPERTKGIELTEKDKLIKAFENMEKTFRDLVDKNQPNLEAQVNALDIYTIDPNVKKNIENKTNELIQKNKVDQINSNDLNQEAGSLVQPVTENVKQLMMENVKMALMAPLGDLLPGAIANVIDLKRITDEVAKKIIDKKFLEPAINVAIGDCINKYLNNWQNENLDSSIKGNKNTVNSLRDAITNPNNQSNKIGKNSPKNGAEQEQDLLVKAEVKKEIDEEEEKFIDQNREKQEKVGEEKTNQKADISSSQDKNMQEKLIKNLEH